MKVMPFDGIVTRAVTRELQENLIGGRIDKIYEPTDTELILTIRNNRKNYSLLISIHPSYARIHLTETSFMNPETPPMFCMTLRKHLIGARIEQIEQVDMERIITISARGYDEIGDSAYHELIVEIMGRHSNVVLLEKKTKKIINAIKNVPPSVNRYRTILPGADYISPPSQNKLNPLTATADELINKLDFNAGKIDRQIVSHLLGFSPFIARELVERTELGSQTSYKKQFTRMQSELNNNDYLYATYKNKREDFHVLPIHYLELEERFNSASELLDHFFANKAERDRITQRVRDLTRLVQNELNKNKRKLKIHADTLKTAKRADRYQKHGELLTANMHLVKKGMDSITVIDYYDENQGEITIKLQTDLTPSENAQRFFNRYRKLLTAQKRALYEKRKTKAEIDYLESILQQLEQAREEDVEEIRNELQEEGYQRQRRKHRSKKQKPQPEQFTASDGTTIYVGRNNNQNEYVTHRLAHKEDIWLHTLDIPGSHVIIKDGNPSEETLLEAAELAAYYSKARQSESVPVDYTKVKYVKKPRGGKPGFVTYTEQKTLFVTPRKLENK